MAGKSKAAPKVVEEDDDENEQIKARGADLSKRKAIKDKLLDIYKDVEAGFRDQWERSNDQMDYWDIYNCTLTSKQFYQGNSQIFVPIVHNAVNARKTRYTNQIFPTSGRYVECVATDGGKPNAVTALLENYVRKAKCRTQMMPAMVRAGDVEGQYNLYVSWSERERHVTWRKRSQPEIEEGVPNPAEEELDDIQEDVIKAGHPEVEVISDSDVLVLPQTSDSLAEAIAAGGTVTIQRRWGKAKIKEMIKTGAIRKDAGDALIEQMQQKSAPQDVNAPKKMVAAAGIQGGSGSKKHLLVYETFVILEVKGDLRLCQAFFGGEKQILGCRRNPLWSDRLPLLSVPVEKVHGAFKGISKVKPCADLQYAANDAMNEAWDSAAYALMPIVMTDPEKNPRVGSMVLSMAAVWETSPKDTQFAQMPALWQQGYELVNQCKAEIAQTLSVSPAAITQGMSTQKNKPNQAEIAQEQQIDILTTADAVTVIEEGILTPMLELFLEYDHQYRDEAITIRQFGEMGAEVGMEEVPPIQMENRYQFRWFGVEQARSAQQIQQQIAMLNVFRGIPPQQMDGYELSVAPLLVQMASNTFGPRLAPLILKSPAQQMPVPIEMEQALLVEGFEPPVHKMDDDQQHIQQHMLLLQQLGAAGENKNARKIQAHIWRHMQQAQQKAAAMQPQPPQGEPGMPGGAGPGVAGTPRMGAQTGIPRTQGPPGMIHQDQMRDPAVMPRKVG